MCVCACVRARACVYGAEWTGTESTVNLIKIYSTYLCVCWYIINSLLFSMHGMNIKDMCIVSNANTKIWPSGGLRSGAIMPSLDPFELQPQSTLGAEHKIVRVRRDWDWCSLRWAHHKVGQYSSSSCLHLQRSEPPTCHEHQKQV